MPAAPWHTDIWLYIGKWATISMVGNSWLFCFSSRRGSHVWRRSSILCSQRLTSRKDLNTNYATLLHSSYSHCILSLKRTCYNIFALASLNAESWVDWQGEDVGLCTRYLLGREAGLNGHIDLEMQNWRIAIFSLIYYLLSKRPQQHSSYYRGLCHHVENAGNHEELVRTK